MVCPTLAISRSTHCHRASLWPSIYRTPVVFGSSSLPTGRSLLDAYHRIILLPRTHRLNNVTCVFLLRFDSEDCSMEHEGS